MLVMMWVLYYIVLLVMMYEASYYIVAGYGVAGWICYILLVMMYELILLYVIGVMVDLLELLVMVAIIGVIWCNFSLLFFFGRGVISVLLEFGDPLELLELLEFGDPLEFLGLLLCFGCIFSLCFLVLVVLL